LSLVSIRFKRRYLLWALLLVLLVRFGRRHVLRYTRLIGLTSP
jgi:hypothetical protein